MGENQFINNNEIAIVGGAGIPSLCGHPQTDTLPAQWHRSVIEGGSPRLD